MIALSVIAAIVTILAGTFAVITRQLAIAYRRSYREEVALNKLACGGRPASAARKAKAKPGAAKQPKPANRPAHSALILR